MKNAQCIVTASVFNGGNNPGTSFILSPIYGTLPKRARVISMTIAESFNVQAGETYLLTLQFTGIHPEYGYQYQHTFTKVDALSLALKAKDLRQNFGPPVVEDNMEESEEAAQMLTNGLIDEMGNEIAEEKAKADDPAFATPNP